VEKCVKMRHTYTCLLVREEFVKEKADVVCGGVKKLREIL